MSNKLTNDNDEIVFKDLVLLLWNDKKFIFKIFAGVMILTLVFTFVIDRPVYKSEARVLINLPAQVTTVYGDYIFPSTDPKAYIDILGNMYKNKVKFTMVKDERYITIMAKGESPEAAQKLAIEATDKYLTTLKLQFKRNATESLLKALEEKDPLYKDQLKGYNEMILELEKLKASNLVKNNSAVVSSQGNSSEVKYDMTTDSVGFTEGLNSGKEYVDAKILVLKTKALEVEQILQKNEAYIKTLKASKEEIGKKYNTDKASELLNNDMNILNQFVSVFSDPTLNLEKVSPRRSVAVAIGIVIGLGLGIFSSLFRNYWKNA